MTKKLFPTFDKWLTRAKLRTWSTWVAFQDGSGESSRVPLSQKRGPMWYTQTWWPGDSLAAMQHSLLRVLAVGHRERLNLVSLITSLAAEHRGSYRAKLWRLARRMESGSTLVAALEQTPDALSDRDVLALRFGSQSGTLGEMFDRLLENHAKDQRSERLGQHYSWFYWVTLAFMIVLILLFLMNAIVPMFMKISEEMGTTPPPAFVGLVAVFGGPQTIIWILAGMTLAIAWFSWSRTPQRFLQNSVAPRLFKPVAQRRIVELYRMLATVLEAGRPLPGALSTLARYHFDGRLRQKLLFARNEVEQGVDVWQSLSDAQVLAPHESRALAGASSGKIRAWTLRNMAAEKLLHSTRKTATLIAWLEPIVILLFAALVLWICYAMFSFLNNLVISLS